MNIIILTSNVKLISLFFIVSPPPSLDIFFFLYMTVVKEAAAMESVLEETPSNSLLRNTRCCFSFPCFSSSQSSTVGIAWWQRIGRSSSKTQSSSHQRNRWWSPAVTAFLKIREWSEIVAGPKWKTFIRRFNRNRSHGNHGKFQYDPLSYALNFDEGQNGDFEEFDDGFGGFRDFSSRYAATKPATPSKAAVDVRGKDVTALA